MKSKFEKFREKNSEEKKKMGISIDGTETEIKKSDEEIEAKEEYGEDVYEVITCMRHGPKEGLGNTPLAENAEKTISKSIENFSLTKDGIKVFTSEAKPERCQKTGEIISKLLGDYKREHREVSPLTNPFFLFDKKERETFTKVIDALTPKNFESFSAFEKEKIQRQIENTVVLHILENSLPNLVNQLEKEKKETFPAKLEKISSQEIAAKFAEWIKLLINASKWLPSKTKINLVNVSHGFNLMAFLKEAMIFEDGTEAKDLEAKKFLEKIGGSIEPSEFFEININRQNKENFEAFLKFRNKNYSLNFSRIEELAKLAKQKRDRKRNLRN